MHLSRYSIWKSQTLQCMRASTHAVIIIFLLWWKFVFRVRFVFMLIKTLQIKSTQTSWKLHRYIFNTCIVFASDYIEVGHESIQLENYNSKEDIETCYRLWNWILSNNRRSLFRIQNVAVSSFGHTKPPNQAVFSLVIIDTHIVFADVSER